ncbi:hypothetical protein M080_4324, partial [Bacteroides fragilis str. 3397 T10]
MFAVHRQGIRLSMLIEKVQIFVVSVGFSFQS